MTLDLTRITGVLTASLVGAALLIAVPGAMAQQAAPAAPAAAPAAPMAKTAHPATHRTRTDRIETRIASLHKRLMITADQEDAWKTVADAMRDNAKTLDGLAADRVKNRDNMNAVEDLKSYQAIADAHADGLKKLVPAFGALYDKMSDAQKKNADLVFGHHPRHAAKKKS